MVVHGQTGVIFIAYNVLRLCAGLKQKKDERSEYKY